jgi:hypothetical protein
MCAQCDRAKVQKAKIEKATITAMIVKTMKIDRLSCPVIQHQVEIKQPERNDLDSLVPGWFPVRIQKDLVSIEQDR